MSVEEEKRARSSAGRKFTHTLNRLNEAIVNKSKRDIIVKKFKDLTILLDNLQSKHDTYLFALHPDVDEPADQR